MTPSSPRPKRTPPAQDGPVRNTMAPPPQSATKTAAPRDPITAAGTAVCGALENGVRTAYAVIDEYMRRGQETARGIFNNDPNRRGTMSDDRGSFPGGFNPSNPIAMFTEQWMTAMRAWSQAWSTFVPGFVPGAWQQTMQQSMMNPFAAATGGAAPAVSVKIASTRPVEVIANISPSISHALDLHELVAEPLRAERFKAPAIDAPEIVREPGKVRVSIKIADKQPAGQYRGVIRKKVEGSVAGDLTVIVS
jgi:hypothetical protein